jgi:hypothetical protein
MASSVRFASSTIRDCFSAASTTAREVSSDAGFTSFRVRLILDSIDLAFERHLSGGLGGATGLTPCKGRRGGGAPDLEWKEVPEGIALAALSPMISSKFLHGDCLD